VSVEDTLFGELGPLCANRVYPLKAPANAAKPYVVYQQVGGQAINFVESEMPGLRNAVFQINCWATTQAAAKALALAVEEAMVEEVALQTTVLSALVMVYDEVAQLYGSRQDFSVWY
jgi:hypothetical protein